jgi:hypothetical protein
MKTLCDPGAASAPRLFAISCDFAPNKVHFFRHCDGNLTLSPKFGSLTRLASLHCCLLLQDLHLSLSYQLVVSS